MKYRASRCALRNDSLCISLVKIETYLFCQITAYYQQESPGQKKKRFNFYHNQYIIFIQLINSGMGSVESIATRDIVGNIAEYLDSQSRWHLFWANPAIRQSMKNYYTMDSKHLPELENMTNHAERFKALVYKFDTVSVYLSPDEWFKEMDITLISTIRFQGRLDKPLLIEWFVKFGQFGPGHSNSKFRGYVNDIKEIIQGRITRNTNHFAVDYTLTSIYFSLMFNKCDQIPGMISFTTRGKSKSIEDIDIRVPERAILIKVRETLYPETSNDDINVSSLYE